MDEIKFIASEFTSELHLSYADLGIKAGSPSLAQDSVDLTLDLNRDLIKHPAATFYAKVVGTSMKGIGINPEDILVIDRSVDVFDGCKAVCYVNGEFAIRELDLREQDRGIIWLKSYNPDYKPIKITSDVERIIWGVVVYVIHKV